MSDNLYDLFQSRFPADRSSLFIETPEGRTYSYDSIEAMSGRFARLLASLGVTPRERVAVHFISPIDDKPYIPMSRTTASHRQPSPAPTHHSQPNTLQA